MSAPQLEIISFAAIRVAHSDLSKEKSKQKILEIGSEFFRTGVDYAFLKYDGEKYEQIPTWDVSFYVATSEDSIVFFEVFNRR